MPEAGEDQGAGETGNGPGRDLTGSGGDEESPATGGIGRSAGRGMAWMVSTTLFVRTGSLVTQVVLGLVLTDEVFGVYAVALSVALAFQILREGGLRAVLVQEGREAFDRNVVPAFWLSFTIAVATALVVGCVIAPLAAHVYHSPALLPVLIVLAASLPIQSFAIPTLARLHIDFRFATGARIDLVSATVRYGGTIALALAGAGALSFAIPVLMVSVVEAVLGWWTTRVRVWKLPMQRSAWRALFRRSKWPLLESLATAGPRQWDYLALGLTASTAVVGTYFFAYQLTFQIVSLVQANARRVILASFSVKHTDRDWLGSALLRTSGAVALLASGGLLALVPTAADIEAMIWHGRWAAAVTSIELLALLLPFALVLLLPDYALQASGRFKLSFVTSLAGNLGIPIVAFAAGTLAVDPSDSWKVALAVGAYTVASSAFQSVVALRVLDISIVRFAGVIAGPATVGVALAAGSRQIRWPGPPAEGVALGFVSFGLGFVLASRLLFRHRLDDLANQLLGDRAARLARRLLAL